MSEVVVTDTGVRGWLAKTAQELGIFQSKKFLTRYYTLNPTNATLVVADSPTDSDDPTVHELRRNRLVKVDTDLSSQLCADYKRYLPKGKASSDIVLPQDRTKPIGLTFADASVMLLWARPGKDFKIWSRAFKRFVQQDER